MQETEINLMDMLFYALRKWRKVVVFAIIVAILAGAFTAVTRVVQMNDPEKIKEWQTEYEVASGAYFAPINELDRQISTNERLATSTQSEIERLELKKTEYEALLEDLKAEIPVYEARIKNYEESIASLEYEKERLEYYLNYRREHNENNLLMAIDPYHVNVYEIYLRVDSGYEIIPDSVYQDTNPATEILQTYNLLVSGTSFYEQMIADLQLNTEVRYLTDVLSVGNYGENSIRVRVISDKADWAKKVTEYISDAILNAHDRVQLSIAEHELTKYNTVSYSVVDNNVYSIQHSYNQEVLNYEASIREVDTSILNTEASIRSTNAEIRDLQKQIEELNITLADMPLNLQEMEDAIGGYNDAIFEFRTEQLELLEEPEPEYEGYTPFNAFTGFVKFAIIGGVVGAVLAFVYFAFLGIMNGKVLSANQVCEQMGSEFFGFWPGKSKKKFLSFIDTWIDNASGCTVKGLTVEDTEEIVISNIIIACRDSKKVMLCGGASKDVIKEVAAAVKARIPNMDIISGGTIALDPVVVRGMAECDAIVMIEQLDDSSLSSSVKLKERAKAMDKPVLGVVVHH